MRTKGCECDVEAALQEGQRLAAEERRAASRADDIARKEGWIGHRHGGCEQVKPAGASNSCAYHVQVGMQDGGVKLMLVSGGVMVVASDWNKVI